MPKNKSKTTAVRNPKTRVKEPSHEQLLRADMYQSSRALDCPSADASLFVAQLGWMADKTLSFEDIATAVAGA